MPYNKHTWVPGEEPTVEKFNRMEDGITNATNTAEAALPRTGGTVSGETTFTIAPEFGTPLSTAGGGTSGRTAAEAQVGLKLTKAHIFSQTNENGDPWPGGIERYPSEPGIYRVTVAVPGLPPGSPGYGVLEIIGTGYVWHKYVDANSDEYWGVTGDVVIAPSIWYKAMRSTGGQIDGSLNATGSINSAGSIGALGDITAGGSIGASGDINAAGELRRNGSNVWTDADNGIGVAWIGMPTQAVQPGARFTYGDIYRNKPAGFVELSSTKNSVIITRSGMYVIAAPLHVGSAMNSTPLRVGHITSGTEQTGGIYYASTGAEIAIFQIMQLTAGHEVYIGNNSNEYSIGIKAYSSLGVIRLRDY